MFQKDMRGIDDLKPDTWNVWLWLITILTIILCLII